MGDVNAIIEASKAWESNNFEACFEWISEGLKLNYRNYELYLMLGQYYSLTNTEQAYLCYENALFYCDVDEDRKQIELFKKDLLENNEVTIKKVAIIILSYNNTKMTQECIESIRKNNDKNSYQLIVIDNASTDGMQDWLPLQKDIIYELNKENKGYPAGCNQGIEIAMADMDVFLLNNDTILPPNALFWLRMGLYESGKIGAVGSVSNSAVNYQQVTAGCQTIDQWIEYGIKNNVPFKHPYESKGWLVGFALLVKRAALNRTGCLDERFTPGNYEDNDFCIRLLLNGYKLLLCKNSFIFHYGSNSFKKKPVGYNNLLRENEKKLEKKWNFNYIPYSAVNPYIIENIFPQANEFFVLEINCKLGCTLSRIKSIYPGAYVLGTEYREILYKLAKIVTNVTPINFEEMYGDVDALRYDYIIIDNTLTTFHNPEAVLTKSKYLLSASGIIILSFNNKNYIGKQEKEALDGKGLGLSDIIEIANKTGLKIMDIAYTKGKLSEEDNKFLQSEGMHGDDFLFYTANTYNITLKSP